MPILICGSFAYDTIMIFPDQFKNHILPDKVHILNVSFLVPEIRKEFGGCAANIAYNLKLLGANPIPMATVGHDFAPYRAHFNTCGINLEHIKVIDQCLTSQAFITTDHDNNQITAFHPGATEHSHENHVRDIPNINLAILSPDSCRAMLQHAQELAALQIPFIFDPGQALPRFTQQELHQLIELADYIITNDYESNLLQARTGLNPQQIIEKVHAYIVTRGSQDTLIYTKETTYSIPPAKPRHIIDPTGCGDAFRAGLIFGIQNSYNWLTTGRIGNLMGALKIEHAGTQNQKFNFATFNQHFQQQFGYSL